MAPQVFRRFAFNDCAEPVANCDRLPTAFGGDDVDGGEARIEAERGSAEMVAQPVRSHEGRLSGRPQGSDGAITFWPRRVRMRDATGSVGATGARFFMRMAARKRRGWRRDGAGLANVILRASACFALKIPGSGPRPLRGRTDVGHAAGLQPRRPGADELRVAAEREATVLAGGSDRRQRGNTRIAAGIFP